MSSSLVRGFNWPLMHNNITREDLDAVIEFLRAEPPPILTQSEQVRAFEQEWSNWLGVKFSVFLNSGSSANLVSLAALRHLRGPGEVIVPPLTWVSDIVAVIQCGFKPVFVDIDLRTLGMNTEQVLEKITPDTRAVFITHILGYNALNQTLLDGLQAKGVPLIEDVCESHGTIFNGRKLGTFGWMSNFSFYYAHHMSTVEGGVVCTDDPEIYQFARMCRAHGLVRESTSNELQQDYREKYPDLNPEFIFAFPAYNMRNNEINAVIGRAQLKRLDANNERRKRNLNIFLSNLDVNKYYTDFDTAGSCNYAFTLVLRQPDDTLCQNVMRALQENGVEFRRGTSGGGNQLRQPYLRKLFDPIRYEDYPVVDHVHFYGFYIGNYPDLDEARIRELCRLLNRQKGGQT